MAYHRKPRTRQERREYQVGLVRAKRSPANLPNSWDDIPKSSAGDRSWKRQRKTRWR